MYFIVLQGEGWADTSRPPVGVLGDPLTLARPALYSTRDTLLRRAAPRLLHI